MRMWMRKRKCVCARARDCGGGEVFRADSGGWLQAKQIVQSVLCILRPSLPTTTYLVMA